MSQDIPFNPSSKTNELNKKTGSKVKSSHMISKTKE